MSNEKKLNSMPQGFKVDFSESIKTYTDGVRITLTIPAMDGESVDSLFDRVSEITSDYWLSPDQLRGASHE